MTNVLKDSQRVENFLRRRGKNLGWQFGDAPDARQSAKVVHSMPALVSTLLMGMLTGTPTLRDVERTSARPRPLGRQPKGTISDSCLYAVATQYLDEAYLQDKLKQQIRQMARDKMLSSPNLPCGVVAVDGKNLATLQHDAEGRAHHRNGPDIDKWRQDGRDGDYWLVPVLRSTLVSAAQKPCIDQVAIAPGTGESTAFAAALASLKSAYGRSNLFEIISTDAGLCSLANADKIVDAGYHYVFGLKGNQKSLFDEAQGKMTLRAETTRPEITTDREKRGGSTIQRQLWRSIEFGSFENTAGRWGHLRQIWLVRQTTRHGHGAVEIEDRFFITSLQRERLDAAQVLCLVRSHWGIENDTFNSLDLQWREDSGPWATQGNAVWALGLLRLMAYNLLQHLRHRHLLKAKATGQRRPQLMSWRSLFETIREAMNHIAYRIEAPTPSTS
jgi:predicted transposase YbfD/YdcC